MLGHGQKNPIKSLKSDDKSLYVEGKFINVITGGCLKI